MKAFRYFLEFVACLRRLRPYIRGGRWLIGSVILSSLFMTALEGAGVSLLVPLLSLLLNGENAAPMRPLQWMEQHFPGKNTQYYVLVLCVVIVLSIGLKNLFAYLTATLAATLKRRVKINLRMALFERIHKLDLQQFDQKPAGEFANLFLVETDRTGGAIELFLYVFQRIAMTFVYIASLLYLSVPLTFFAILLGLLLGGLFTIIYRRLVDAGYVLTEQNRLLSSFLVEAFAGMRVVRVTNSEKRQRERFREINVAQAEAEKVGVQANATIPCLAETFGIIGAMGIIGGAYAFFVIPKLMLASQLLGFGFFLLRLLPLMNQIYGMQGGLFYYAGGVIELEKWLNLPQFPLRPFGSKPFNGVQRSIQFQDVVHEYSAGRRALNGVTFEIPAGKTVAIVGPSGAGKTTVASLLLRLREPVGGRIMVDGVNYWEFSPESWHRNIAVVEQEAFLFHESLAENVAYGYPGATKERVVHAIQQANLTDFVTSLPEGINTMVGERGHSISGGQRQRLAIARALVREPSVLILDEATSSLDPVSEQAVQAALRQASIGRTVMVIAHRLSTIRSADLIVVLKEGNVAEQGTWDELASSKGVFADMLRQNQLVGAPRVSA